jgi:2-polyprenyl-6-hydroxyphenyl methylase/3-demethylubiquinone-9 3-methyltransferase
MTSIENVHLHEIHKFGSQAERWWDPKGEFMTLHAVNPLRLQFIHAYTELEGKRIVDVGCGGGILSEGLARMGADVLGVDKVSAEALAEEQPAQFDVVTCMEMLEHVPNPVSIVKACAKLVKPGGKLFFSTLNRHPKAYLLAIFAAEKVLRMIPKGTHDYNTFIKPSELGRWTREAGLELLGMEGVSYHPLTGQFSLGRDIDVNYLAAFSRPKD